MTNTEKLKINSSSLLALSKRPWPGVRTNLWDQSLPGFGVRWSGQGKLSLIMRFRPRGQGEQFFTTLGDWPSLHPDIARERAMAIRAAAHAGRNLIEEERAAQAVRDRDTIPLSSLLDAWRATTQAIREKRMAQGESGSYEKELLRLEAQSVRPIIGKYDLGRFDPDQLQACIDAARPGDRRNVRALLVRFVKHARIEMRARGVKLTWPVRYEVEVTSRSRWERYTLEEMARIWIAAGKLGRRGALIRFLMLTGCRRSEAALATWHDMVLDDPVLGAHWNQPAARTKTRRPYRVALSAPAVALLRWLPPRAARKGGEADLIFAGRGNRPVGGWTAILATLREVAHLQPGATLHDFRRTLVSVLGDHGFDAQVADGLLNHSQAASLPGVMATYNRSDMWLKRREALDLWVRLLFDEVDRAQGTPVSRESWGFDAPFEDVRLVRPRVQISTAGQPGAAVHQPRSADRRAESRRRPREAARGS